MRRASWFGLVAALALVAAACGDTTEITVTSVVTEQVETPGATVTSIVTETETVTSVVTSQVEVNRDAIEVMASWGGAEQAGFLAVLSYCTGATGVPITYTSERDLPTVLPTRVAGGNAPAIAMIPRPGIIQQLVDDEVAVPLADLGLDAATLSENYAQGVLDLGTFNGTGYGLLTASNSKSTFWYKPPSFEAAGFETPDTFADLQAIVEGYVAAGATPLSIGGLDGWTLTDWFENIYVRVAGPEAYNQLFVTHEIEFTDPTVVETMELFRSLIAPTGERLSGGAAGTLSTGFIDAFNLVLRGDAEMYYEGGFMGNFARDNFPDLVAGEDYSFFEFPSVDPAYGKPVVGGGDFAVAFDDEESTALVMGCFASAEANTVWASQELGNRITPHRGVPATTHADALTQLEAAAIANADIFVFDGSDLAPGAVGGDAMFTGLQDFIDNPDDIDSVLEFIEAAADAAF